MVGKVIKQINNLKITKDNKGNCYRIYAPDGKELYRTASLVDAQYQCKGCETYKKNGKKNFVEVEVDWDIDTDNILGALDDMYEGDAAKALGISLRQYKSMNEDKRYKYVYDCLNGYRYKITNNDRPPHDIDKSGIIGLPKKVMIELTKIDLEDSDSIANYLSENYGFCVVNLRVVRYS